MTINVSRRARRPRRAVRNDVHTVYTARRVVAPYWKRLSSSTPTSYLLPPIFFIIAVKEDCCQTSFTRLAFKYGPGRALPVRDTSARAVAARPPLPCKGEGDIRQSFLENFGGI